VMKPKPEKTPYARLSEFSEQGHAIDLDLRFWLEGLNRRRQIRQGWRAMRDLLVTPKGRTKPMPTVFRVLAYFTALATLGLIVFQFVPFWQLLTATAFSTATILLSLPTPMAFNLGLASMTSVLVLGWPFAILRGAYLGVNDHGNRQPCRSAR
jgi:hypothetical protein